MPPSQIALNILEKIRALADMDEFELNDPTVLKRFDGLTKILKMRTASFLQNDTRSIYLKEQVWKIEEYKNFLCGAESPRLWMSHDDCRHDIIRSCIFTEGLIKRHATENEKADL
jgi:hypothetical protein